MNPAPDKLSLGVFGAALQAARTKRGYSLANLAKGLGKVSQETIRDWEAGVAAPGKVELKQLFAMAPELKRFEAHLRSGNYIAQRYAENYVAVAPRDVSVEDLLQPKPPRTFGEALRRERTKAALSDEQLAELVGVTRAAVGWWETDRNVPVRENYEQLMSLFPALKDAPEPDWRDIEKPNGGAGSQRAVARQHEPEPDPEPMPAPDHSRPRLVGEPDLSNMQMPAAQPASSAVSVQALVTWTSAAAQLKLDKHQVERLSSLLRAGSELGLSLPDVAAIVEQLPRSA